MLNIVFFPCRVLTDSQTKLGEEYILSAFPFECDKLKAMHILNTVRNNFKVYYKATSY